MSALFSQLAILMLFGIFGYAFTKLKVLDADSASILSRLEVYLFLPATVIKSFSTYFTVENFKEKYNLPVTSCILLAVLVLAVFSVMKLVKCDKFDKCVIAYSLIISNYAYIGYSLASAVFGDKMQFEVIFFCIPFSIFTYTVGYSMLSSSKDKPKYIVAKRIINPLTMALAVGAFFGLTGIVLPDVLKNFLNLSSNCMGPVSMILAGIVISQFKFKSFFTDYRAYIIVFIKILVLPLLGAVVIGNIPFMKSAVVPAVMMLSMPCGLNSIVFPKMNGNYSEIGNRLVFISTILCSVTIPICVAVAQHFA